MNSDPDAFNCKLYNYFPFSQRIARIFESGFLGHLSTQESVTLLRTNATRLKIWKTVVLQFWGAAQTLVRFEPALM